MAFTAKQKREAREAERAAREGGSIAKLNEASALNAAAVPSAAGDVEKPTSSGEKVIVACKLGVAYFDIQLCREEEVQENTQTGPRTIKRYARTGKVVRLRGTAYPRGTAPDGFPEKPVIYDGAALNFGVDKDFFDAWMRQNRLNPVVMNRMVFAHASVDGVRAVAREEKDRLSGLDPVNPKGDVRMPKPTNAAVGNIETEESRAKRMAAAG